MVRLARRVGWQRLAYECLRTLICAFVATYLHIAHAPSELWLSLLYVLVGLVGTLIVLPLRLVRPMTALVAGAVLTVLTAGTSLTLIVLSAGAGYRARRPAAVVAGFVTVLACTLTAVGLEIGLDASGVLLGIVLCCATVVLPAAIAAMIAQRRLLVMTMHQRNLELHTERKLVAGQAQVRERNRIAAELHDSLGHRLTLMSLYTGGLSQALITQPSSATSTITAGPQVQEALGRLRESSAQAMSELRQILQILHQDNAVEGAGRSMDEVDQTVASARGTGTEIELLRSGNPRPLNLLAEHAGYRVVQEGITNALRHAGGAPIRVQVRYEEEALFVEVSNRPGRSYQGKSTGQGLQGLAERVRLAAGVLSYGRLNSGDFRIGAVLPYDALVPEPLPDQDTDDFPQDIRRSSRRQRFGLIAVIGAVGVSLTCLIAAFLVPGEPESLSRVTFETFEVGDPVALLRPSLPVMPLYQRSRPGFDSCEAFLADPEVQPDDGTELHYEVCFVDDELVAKEVLRRPAD